MPLTFQCPHCAGTTLVADEFAGSRGPCAHCGIEVEIPDFHPSPYERPRTRQRQRWGLTQHQMQVIGSVLGVIMLVVAVGAAVIATIPIWKRARIMGQRNRCHEQLAQIHSALRAYEAAHGRLPPAYVVDSAGQPMYSWRVLILPYLGDEANKIHQQFHLNEAWNSWHNRWVAGRMPKVFASPFDSAAVSFNESSYKVIVGPNTLFPTPPKDRALSDVTDDPRLTIAVIECITTGATFWTQPDALDTAKMSFGIADGTPMQLGGCDPDGANALFADGSVGTIGAGTGVNPLKALTTADRGDAAYKELIIWAE